jgi:hypothetical protein
MLSPSSVESSIIRSLISDKLGPDSRFLNQIPLLQCPKRDLTGTGYFVEFAPLPESLRADPEDTVLSTDLATRLPSPGDVVGFTLFIDGGFMSSFEGYTFGDTAWPEEPMEDWLIVGASVDTRSSDESEP